jgi:hypothetical protein
MFFTRPDIQPLGWNLKALPAPNGSQNFDAVTTDGAPVSFRFSGGWLEARRSIVDGTTNFFEMSTVSFLRQIAPFGTTEILPEQLCELLGITVEGKEISHPDVKLFSTGNYFHPGYFINLSGEMTYWRSTHRMSPQGDIAAFVKDVVKALPNAVLFEHKFGTDYKFSSCRKIEVVDETIKRFCVGIDGDTATVDKMFKTGQEPENKMPLDRLDVFPFCIVVTLESMRSQLPLPWEKALAPVNHTRAAQIFCHIHIDFKTDDAIAKKHMAKFIDVIKDYFSWGRKVIDLENGKTVYESSTSPSNFHDSSIGGHSYSKALKARCNKQAGSYLDVGVTKPESPDFLAHIARSLGKTQFLYGIKPL